MWMGHNFLGLIFGPKGMRAKEFSRITRFYPTVQNSSTYEIATKLDP